MIDRGALNHFTSAGVRVMATDIKKIEEAIDLYLKEDLNHLETHVD